MSDPSDTLPDHDPNEPLRIVGPRWMFESFLAERRERDIDHWDEVWEGEIHLGPLPSVFHNDLGGDLLPWLKEHCRAHELGRMLPAHNLRVPGSGDKNFRCPDLGFIAAASPVRMTEDGVWFEAEDVVFEILSPHDEAYKKFDFYAARGVRAIVIVDTKSRRPEVYRLAGQNYLAVAAASDGWVACEPLAVEFRAGQRKGQPALEVRCRIDPEHATAI